MVWTVFATVPFFGLLGARWRYAGPIQLIAAPDLAGRSIDPDEFLDFLSGRLRHRFISRATSSAGSPRSTTARTRTAAIA